MRAPSAPPRPTPRRESTPRGGDGRPTPKRSSDRLARHIVRPGIEVVQADWPTGTSMAGRALRASGSPTAERWMATATCSPTTSSASTTGRGSWTASSSTTASVSVTDWPTSRSSRWTSSTSGRPDLAGGSSTRTGSTARRVALVAGAPPHRLPGAGASEGRRDPGRPGATPTHWPMPDDSSNWLTPTWRPAGSGSCWSAGCPAPASRPSRRASDESSRHRASLGSTIRKELGRPADLTSGATDFGRGPLRPTLTDATYETLLERGGGRARAGRDSRARCVMDVRRVASAGPCGRGAPATPTSSRSDAMPPRALADRALRGPRRRRWRRIGRHAGDRRRSWPPGPLRGPRPRDRHGGIRRDRSPTRSDGWASRRTRSGYDDGYCRGTRHSTTVPPS